VHILGDARLSFPTRKVRELLLQHIEQAHQREDFIVDPVENMIPAHDLDVGDPVNNKYRCRLEKNATQMTRMQPRWQRYRRDLPEPLDVVVGGDGVEHVAQEATHVRPRVLPEAISAVEPLLLDVAHGPLDLVAR